MQLLNIVVLFLLMWFSLLGIPFLPHPPSHLSHLHLFLSLINLPLISFLIDCVPFWCCHHLVHVLLKHSAPDIQLELNIYFFLHHWVLVIHFRTDAWA